MRLGYDNLFGGYDGYNLNLSTTQFFQTAWSCYRITPFGPECPEDPRVRAFVSNDAPAVFFVELYALATFNMMDPELAMDVTYSMQVCNAFFKRTSNSQIIPQAYALQGAGPHFCPGGNPNPNIPRGTTAFTSAPYVNYVSFVGIRENGIPSICCGHGSQVGGGVAYALNNTIRIGASTNTVCFGNASRGAVPGMLLSKNIPNIVGMSAAVDIYLTDNTYSAYANIKAGFLYGCAANPSLTKMRGAMLARQMAATPCARLTTNMHVGDKFDMWRFGDEGVGIVLAGKSGQMFASLNKAIVKSSAPKEEEQIEDDWQEYERPRRKKKGGKRRGWGEVADLPQRVMPSPDAAARRVPRPRKPQAEDPAAVARRAAVRGHGAGASGAAVAAVERLQSEYWNGAQGPDATRLAKGCKAATDAAQAHGGVAGAAAEVLAGIAGAVEALDLVDVGPRQRQDLDNLKGAVEAAAGAVTASTVVGVCAVLIDAACHEKYIAPLTRLLKGDKEGATQLPGRLQLRALFEAPEVERRMLEKLTAIGAVLLEDKKTAGLSPQDAASAASAATEALRGWVAARAEALAAGPLADLLKKLGDRLPL